MADIDNVTVGENNYNLRDSAAQNALPTQGQVDDIITALNTIANKTDHPYNPDNKLPSDYVNDTNQTHKFATQAQLTQIETNKNNILLTADQSTQYNIFDFANSPVVNSTTTYTKTNSSIAVSSSNATWKYVTLSTPLKAGTYIYQFKVSDYVGTGTESRIVITTDSAVQNQIGAKAITGNGTFTIQFTVASDMTIYFTYFATQGTAGTNSFTASENMIISKSLYDAGFTGYQPFALPNTAITPALQECVDNGKKNKLNINLTDLKSFNSSNVSWNNNVATSTDGHITITFNSDNTLTVVSDGSNAQLEFKLATQANSPLSNGALVLSGCPDTGSATTYDLRALITTSTTTYVNNYSGGTAFNYAGSTYTVNIVIRASQTLNKTFKPMICTEAEYKASQTYQPYAMSNAELTAQWSSKQVSKWATSFSVPNPSFGQGELIKLYVYGGNPASLAMYLITSNTVVPLTSTTGISYTIQTNTSVDFTTTSTCLAYYEYIRFATS